MLALAMAIAASISPELKRLMGASSAGAAVSCRAVSQGSVNVLERMVSFNWPRPYLWVFVELERRV